MVYATRAAGQPNASYAPRHWPIEEGLPVNAVRDFAEGPQGHLWMSANRVIFRVEKQELVAFVQGEIDRVDPVVYTGTDGSGIRRRKEWR